MVLSAVMLKPAPNFKLPRTESFDHRSFHFFWKLHLAVQLPQKRAMRHNDGQFQGCFQRKVMQVEAQGLRDRTEDIEKIEGGHNNGCFYGAKITNPEK